jgi:hypothetical protein
MPIGTLAFHGAGVKAGGQGAAGMAGHGGSGTCRASTWQTLKYAGTFAAPSVNENAGDCGRTPIRRLALQAPYSLKYMAERGGRRSLTE